MLTKPSTFVNSIFGRTLETDTSISKDSILSLGILGKTELNKAHSFIVKKDPQSAKHLIFKSCWYMDKMVQSLEAFTGISLEKSAAQTNAVRDRIDNASDWINTANESGTYDVLAKCEVSLKRAIDALIDFASSIDDSSDIAKSKCENITERMIYKAWQRKDGSWWDTNPQGGAPIQVEPPSGGESSGNALSESMSVITDPSQDIPSSVMESLPDSYEDILSVIEGNKDNTEMDLQQAFDSALSGIEYDYKSEGKKYTGTPEQLFSEIMDEILPGNDNLENLFTSISESSSKEDKIRAAAAKTLFGIQNKLFSEFENRF